MNKTTIVILKTPLLGRLLLIFYRAYKAGGYVLRPLGNFLRWLFVSKETTNFTYDLEDLNKKYLASLIADITGKDIEVILAYMAEIEADAELRCHILNTIQKSELEFLTDNTVHFGRRIGWYAIVRALKPKTIIETGVDKGLGSCVLAAALKRNSQEGHPGRYYGTDINPNAGFLFKGDYANYGSILYGDSIDSLKRFDGVIDLFINDSDHSTSYEAQEYQTVAQKLSAHAVILGDNSVGSDKLLEFSLRTNRCFIFFREQPQKHWYPGGGIGISYKRKQPNQNSV
jgi:hypothetical protein